MTLILDIRVASVIIVALAYMLLDLFNNRDMPELFAYATIAYAFVLTLLYMNAYSILVSLGIAAVVFAFGYLVYRVGQLGLGDVIEFAAISMMLPFLQSPILTNAIQYGLPFVLNVVIASGVAALVLVPLFYIPRAVRRSKKSILLEIKPKEQYKSIFIGAAYIALIAALSFTGVINLYGVVIFAAIAFGSVFTTLFERQITNSMIVMESAEKLVQEDMIAINMLSDAEKKKLSSEIKSFGQLVTKKMVKEIKEKNIRIKVPVYRNGIPFAVPIFVGIIISLLFGNLLILAIH